MCSQKYAEIWTRIYVRICFRSLRVRENVCGGGKFADNNKIISHAQRLRHSSDRPHQRQRAPQNNWLKPETLKLYFLRRHFHRKSRGEVCWYVKVQWIKKKNEEITEIRKYECASNYNNIICLRYYSRLGLPVRTLLYTSILVNK